MKCQIQVMCQTVNVRFSNLLFDIDSDLLSIVRFVICKQNYDGFSFYCTQSAYKFRIF